MRKTVQHLDESAANGAVQSVERAFDLLEYLAQSSGWVGVSELSEATGQPVGTVHRLLATLVARNYAVRDSRTRRYAAGPALRRLAVTDLQEPDWAAIATPHLRELVEISGETANLAILEGNRAVYMAQAQSTRMVRMFTELGNRVLLHCTGCGKVLLAHQPDSVIATIIAESGLARYTDTTITDPGQFQQELEMIRRQGYAIDNGEQEEGVRCLAVPVFNSEGKVVAAISVSGPGSRLDSRSIPSLLPQIKRISAVISSALATLQEHTNGVRQVS